MGTKKAAASLKQAQPQGQNTNDIISNPAESVKTGSNKLRELRLSKRIPAKDMVEVVRQIYPKYDKTIQSKCESEEYGIQLRPDAMDALLMRFATGPPASCRIPDEVYADLRHCIHEDGYPDPQSWFEHMVAAYLSTQHEQTKGDSHD